MAHCRCSAPWSPHAVGSGASAGHCFGSLASTRMDQRPDARKGTDWDSSKTGAIVIHSHRKMIRHPSCILVAQPSERSGEV